MEGSDPGALPAFRPVGFRGPPNPDVRLPPHPALHVLMPLSGGLCLVESTMVSGYAFRGSGSGSGSG